MPLVHAEFDGRPERAAESEAASHVNSPPSDDVAQREARSALFPTYSAFTCHLATAKDDHDYATEQGIAISAENAR